jgi:hypothetical protein
MGIVRTVEWRLICPPEETKERLRQALDSLGIETSSDNGSLRGKTSRSLRRNRWAAEISIDVDPLQEGSRAVCHVDMVGSKHYAILDELAEALGEDAFDDRGIASAIERLGKVGRIFGRKEVRHLRHLIRATEQIAALGQGQYGKKMGIVVLTDERLFFFEKGLLATETLEEFSLKAITSLEVSKKLTGEMLVIHASGNRSEITQLKHGGADEIARAFRALKEREGAVSGPGAPAPAAAPDAYDQLRKLGELRDAGVLTNEEFDAKKAALLEAM